MFFYNSLIIAKYFPVSYFDKHLNFVDNLSTKSMKMCKKKNSDGTTVYCIRKDVLNVTQLNLFTSNLLGNL